MVFDSLFTKMKQIEGKWVYKIKENLGRTIEKLKARLDGKRTSLNSKNRLYKNITSSKVIYSLTTIYDWSLR